MTDRRAVLSVAGSSALAALSGCLGAARKAVKGIRGETAEGHQDNEEQQNENQSIPIDADTGYSPTDSTDRVLQHEIDTRVTIESGSYTHWKLDVSEAVGPLRLVSDIVVRNGPSVDLYLLAEDEFRAFRNGERFRYQRTVSAKNVSSRTETHTALPDDYVLVLDNDYIHDVDVEIEFRTYAADASPS